MFQIVLVDTSVICHITSLSVMLPTRTRWKQKIKDLNPPPCLLPSPVWSVCIYIWPQYTGPSVYLERSIRPPGRNKFCLWAEAKNQTNTSRWQRSCLESLQLLHLSCWVRFNNSQLIITHLLQEICKMTKNGLKSRKLSCSVCNIWYRDWRG